METVKQTNKTLVLKSTSKCTDQETMRSQTRNYSFIDFSVVPCVPPPRLQQ